MFKTNSNLKFDKELNYCGTQYFNPNDVCDGCGKNAFGSIKCKYRNKKVELCSTCYDILMYEDELKEIKRNLRWKRD